MKLCKFIFVVGVACFLSGCMAVPWPASKKQTLSGVRIQFSDTKFIKTGKTTLAEVEGKFGSPSARFDDIRVLAYIWEEPSSYLILFSFLPYAPAQDYDQLVGKFVSLLIEVESNDHVRRFDIVERKPGETARSHAVAWAKQGGNAAALALPTAFAPATAPEGKALLYAYRHGGINLTLHSDAVTVNLDGATRGDLRQYEYVALVVEPGPHSLGLNTHLLGSGKGGDLDLPNVPCNFKFEATPNQTHYVEIRPLALNVIEVRAKMVSEREALKALKKLKPW
jgi:hypothetical protein